MKKLLICLTVLFSTFLFINSIDAYTTNDTFNFELPPSKNKFNSATATKGKYLKADGSLQTNSDWYLSDYIPVEPNEQYTISGTTITGGDPISLGFYDINKNLISTLQHYDYIPPKTITIPENCYYIRDSIYKGDISTYQIEKGTIATDYVKYYDDTQTVFNYNNTRYSYNILFSTYVEGGVLQFILYSFEKEPYLKKVDDFYELYTNSDSSKWQLTIWTTNHKSWYYNGDSSLSKADYYLTSIKFNTQYSKIISTNFDLKDKDGNVIDFDTQPTTFNITFHLNGGVVTDSYESELERKAIIEEMKTIYNDDGILDNYPSINNDWLKLFISPSIEKIQNFFEKYLTSLDKQTKLLQLYEKILNKDYKRPIYYDKDYSINIESDKLMEYLINQEVSKEPMQFVGWYYDEKLTQKVNSTDTIDSDKHFYAKYEYKDVDDFLNNTTFNSYTFDENYQYAVISLNNQQNRDIYLGLNIMSHNLEVYKYNKINLNYEQSSSLCLSPIFSKNNKYYYRLSDSLDNTYEVLIIPKEKLNGNYEFLLSTNAHVSYTNDLKNVVIKDESGNDMTTDMEDSYNYSQDILLREENDLLEIFKDLINNKDNNVFSYFNQVWNYMKRNKLFTYFMTLIIGSLIILIIKAASR